jgi:ankyrin repeat protein
MMAALNGNAEAAEVLLELGADPSIPEQDGYTPLHGAAFQGRAETARVLIADARVPNEQHSDGSWPIHRACWGTHPRHAETVRAILESARGADQLELRDAKGHTPMFLANQSGNKATVAVIAEFRRRAKTRKQSGEL